MIDARPQTGTARTNKRQCGIQPAHQSLITDVFGFRPLLCTIHHLSNCTLARVENVAVVPAVLDKGHQSERTNIAPDRMVKSAVGHLRPLPALALTAAYPRPVPAMATIQVTLARTSPRIVFFLGVGDPLYASLVGVISGLRFLLVGFLLF